MRAISINPRECGLDKKTRGWIKKKTKEEKQKRKPQEKDSIVWIGWLMGAFPATLLFFHRSRQICINV